MADSSLHSTLLLLVSLGHVAAHGSTFVPRPRNAEPASRGSIPYGVRLYAADSGVAMATHNQHLCPEGGGYQTEVYPTGQCVPNPTTQPERPSYLFSLSPPAVAGRLVDCTPHDNCTAASLLLPGKTQIPPSDTRPPDAESRQSVEGVYDVEGVETVETGRNAWLTVFPPSSNCSRPPVTTYKLRRGACTQLPVTGDTYWTGGCRGWACQWFSQGASAAMGDDAEVLPTRDGREMMPRSRRLGCAAGCASCTGDAKVDHCPTATAPTLPDRFRTFGIGEAAGWTRQGGASKGEEGLVMNDRRK